MNHQMLHSLIFRLDTGGPLWEGAIEVFSFAILFYNSILIFLLFLRILDLKLMLFVLGIVILFD